MTKTSAPKKPKQDERAAFRPGDKSDHDSYNRHLHFDHVVAPENATQRERFEAVARSLRDLLTERWLLTQRTHDELNPKRVYYLSLEFLIGRTLVNNIVNLGVEKFVRDELQSDPRQDWKEVIETEPDAGLGNGGLGRLAACFIESLATLQIPAIGYGLRYDYGIFRQQIENGFQVEYPDHWLAQPDPWEVSRPRETVQVPLGCSFRLEGGVVRAVECHSSHLLGVPYDRPVVGYGGHSINTLRLWGAASSDFFDFGEFSSGDFVGAIVDRLIAETVTRVLYPDDSTVAGQALRFVQEYFLVCCSLGDIVARFRRTNDDWKNLPDKVAIQLNDTHPAMAVAELMRILLDQAKLGWDEAWDLSVRTLAYTNHTLLPEALEKWPVRFFELVCPRLLEIVFEINRRFLGDVQQQYPGDDDRARRMSLIEETPARQVRMANLSIVGTHSTNGVARIHSDLLRTRVVCDFADMFPQRFNNKTNGVTPRRWLLLANPELSGLITETIGEDWITDLSQLRRLLPLADDAAFRARFRRAKQAAKERFAVWLKATLNQVVDPNSIFDSQIKRIHEYKRQLLNALHIVVLYNRLRSNPTLDVPPRTFFFAGKAAPAYRLAKLIIKFINNIAATIDNDPAARGRIKVIFLPNYNVSLAERLIPASNVSEQISTAGYEASGTGNMKFMMNGALTIGTRDGATIEMAEEAGEENFFLFGLAAAEVQNNRSWYNPLWHYENEVETRQALDLIFTDHFSRDEPGIFAPIREMLLERGDYYMHLADLTSYAQAQQRLGELYTDHDEWSRKAIVNVACSGKFSSDRTIAEYAAEIWNAEPVRWYNTVRVKCSMPTALPSPYCDAAGHPRLLMSVAGFIDMLGFSQMSVSEASSDQLQQLLERIAGAIDDSRRFVRETMADGDAPSTSARWGIKYFSDNLVLGHPIDVEGGDPALAAIFVIRCAQRYQLRMSLNGFFIRGALTQGLICLTDDIIFGPTLVESYQLESKTAIVPRILVTEPLQQCVRNHCRENAAGLPSDVRDLICWDIDGWWFVNYLEAAREAEGINWQFIARHKESILTSLSGTKRHDVLPKFGWACRYHNVFCHWQRSDPGYRDEYRIDRRDEQSTIRRIEDVSGEP